uniref:Uncharacterized protein n=1 Tax=Arundo donax TaxID=35708 RepID=A0A0A9B4M5_ARUDO
MLNISWPHLLGRQRDSKRLHARDHTTHGGVADRRLVVPAATQPPNHQTKPPLTPSAAPIRALQDPDLRLPGPPGRRIHAPVARSAACTRRRPTS